MFRIRIAVTENKMTLDELAEKGITPATVLTMLNGEERGWVVEYDAKNDVHPYI